MSFEFRKEHSTSYCVPFSVFLCSDVLLFRFWKKVKNKYARAVFLIQNTFKKVGCEGASIRKHSDCQERMHAPAKVCLCCCNNTLIVCFNRRQNLSDLLIVPN